MGHSAKNAAATAIVAARLLPVVRHLIGIPAGIVRMHFGYYSAATLLGLTSMVYFKGYDGFIYAVCFFIGWPIILFLMAERLRNLGRYTFADVASFRLKQMEIRSLSACGTLVAA
mgnify:CR=1 FL=1